MTSCRQTEPDAKGKNTLRQALADLGYSLRRSFIDDFYMRHAPELPAGARVLDLGGNRVRKRGVFDIELLPLEVVYSNLVTEKEPNVQNDAVLLPFRDEVFDAVICSEVLEHVPSPPKVLREVARVLRKDGRLLLCAPFMVPVHADPFDYGRYTEFYWQKALESAGLRAVQVERHGGFWCVLVDMVRDYVYKLQKENRPRWRFVQRWLCSAVTWAKARAPRWDKAAGSGTRPGYTTGYGVYAVRN